VHNTDLLVRIN